jgi:hypothetical protein
MKIRHSILSHYLCGKTKESNLDFQNQIPFEKDNYFNLHSNFNGNLTYLQWNTLGCNLISTDIS